MLSMRIRLILVKHINLDLILVSSFTVLECIRLAAQVSKRSTWKSSELFKESLDSSIVSSSPTETLLGSKRICQRVSTKSKSKSTQLATIHSISLLTSTLKKWFKSMISSNTRSRRRRRSKWKERKKSTSVDEFFARHAINVSVALVRI